MSKDKDLLTRLASLELSQTEQHGMELIQSLERQIDWLASLPPEELQAWMADIKAFRQKIGDEPIMVSTEPKEALRAMALGYYSLALEALYRYKELEDADRPEEESK